MKKAKFKLWIVPNPACRWKGALWDDDARLQTPRNTTLFAALELAQGKVVGECYQRHRHQEFLKFHRRLHEKFPGPVPTLAGQNSFSGPVTH
jgi:hypothetical protein